MNSLPQSNYEYQDGGTLPPDSLTYVMREADDVFYKSLKGGKFCYVLNSRQMGKSSLRVRTMQRLESERIACAAIDISINTNVSQEQWYVDLIDTLINQLDLLNDFDLDNWWSRYSSLSPMRRFEKFIEEVLLDTVNQNIVIFIDEIDSVISLDFKVDDFFAFIRKCYNLRADNSQYKRLSFALLGVATPSDLIKDKTRTPFNIGKGIQLDGFQIKEITPLAKGLEGKVDNPFEVLKQILNWTGGQPYLTHRICKLVKESQSFISTGNETTFIKGLVRTTIINDWEYQDKQAHLQTIRNRIIESNYAGRLLGLYQQILNHSEKSPDDSLEEMELRLSGLVVEKKGKLKTYNQIYERVFNQNWVNEQLTQLRPYAESINAWLSSNCCDDSRLLRGQALEDAIEWTTGKSLSNDDYQYLQASREQEWKLLRFKFQNGEASNITELINLSDRFPDEAEDFLFNNFFERWLVAHLGRTDLAAISQNIVDLYDEEKRKGLEIFIRSLCEKEGLEAFPKVFTIPDKLNFGQIPAGYQQNYSLTIANDGRPGFFWGEIYLEGNMPGLKIENTSINSLSNIPIYINFDTLYVPCGVYQGYIVFALVGIKEYYKIPVNYEILELEVNIKPENLKLGFIKNKKIFENIIEVTCQSNEGRIYGDILISTKNIESQPSNFEASSVSISLTVNTTRMESGSHEYLMTIKSSMGIYKIPIYFKIPIHWENILVFSGFSALMTGIISWFIRYSSSFYQSIPNNLESVIFNRVYFTELIVGNGNNNAYIFLYGLLGLFITSLYLGRYFIKKNKNELLFHLVFISMSSLLLVSIINSYFFTFLTRITRFYIILIDIIIFPLNWIGIKQFSTGWLIVGTLVGFLIGILSPLIFTKKK